MLIQVILAFFSALISVIIAYGAIASAVIGLLGPVFIPFLVFDKAGVSVLGMAPRLHWILLSTRLLLPRL